VKAVALNPEASFLAIASCVLTLLPVFMPSEGILLTTLIPLPLLVLAVKYPWRYVVGLVGIEAGVLWLLEGWQALLFVSQHGLVPLVIAGAIWRGCSVACTMVSSVLIPLGVGSLFLVGYSIVTHQPFSLVLTSYLDQVVHAVHTHLGEAEQTQGVEGEPLAVLAETLPRLIRAIFPALLVINQLFINVLNYVLARYYCAHSHPPVWLDGEALTCWRASEYLVWVFLAGGAMLLLPFALLSTIGLNVFLLTLAVYLLQGVAIVVFWGRRVPFPPGVRWLLVLMAFIVTGPLGVVLCIAAGLFDLWADFRRLRRHPLVP
jgi:hypothetical protein